MRIAINGFGRIGRNFLRVILQDSVASKKLDVVAINIGPARPEFVAHMFKYDTLMGTYPGTVECKNDELIINGHVIQILAQLDPCDINWGEYKIDWVVDASGAFTVKEKAQVHCDVGAKHVLITAPAKGDVVTIVPGVNDDRYKPSDQVVSLGSCTTNAFMPMLKVLEKEFGIQAGFMTTMHAYTNTQVLLDVEAQDLRRSRAAALNIIPTSTGAAKLIGKIIPELEGKICAIAVRVPVAKVSLMDLSIVSKKKCTAKEVNDAFTLASQTYLKDILAITFEPLVSSDLSKTRFSVVIDGLLTTVCDNLVTAFGWYDNEWGYCERLKDFLLSVRT